MYIPLHYKHIWLGIVTLWIVLTPTENEALVAAEQDHLRAVYADHAECDVRAVTTVWRRRTEN